MATAGELEYLRRQKAKQELARQQGVQPVNQGFDDGNDLAWSGQNQQPTAEQEKSGWQSFIDWGAGAKNQLLEGLLNVVDSIGDAGLNIIGGLFGGGWGGAENDLTKWAQEAAKTDWEAPVLNESRKFAGFSLLNPEIYTNDYWTGGYGSTEAARQKVEEQKQFTDNETWQNIHNRAWTGAGEVLGNVALMEVAPASVPANIAFRAVTGAAQGLGSGFEQASQEGASFQQASGYGGIKAAVQGVTSAVLYKAGAQGYGPYAGTATKFGSFVFDKTGSGVLAKAVDIAQRAGMNAAMSAAEEAFDPVVKQITYKANALDEAYGTDEARSETLGRMLTAFATSFATSAIMQAAPAAFERVKLGKEGYNASYELKIAQRYQADFVKHARQWAIEDDPEKAQKYFDLMQRDYEKIAPTVEKFDRISKNAIWENGKLAGFSDSDSGLKANETTENLIKQGNTLGSTVESFGKSAALYRFLKPFADKNGKISSATLEAFGIINPQQNGFDFDSNGDGSFTATDNSTGRKYPISIIGDTAVYKPVSVSNGIRTVVNTDSASLPTDVLAIDKGNETLIIGNDLLKKAVEAGASLSELANAIVDLDVSNVAEQNITVGSLTFQIGNRFEDSLGKPIKFVANLQFFGRPRTRDPFGYINFDGAKFGISEDTANAIDTLDSMALDIDNNMTEGDGDGNLVYPRKVFVRRVNAASDAILSYLRDELYNPDDFSISEDDTIEDLNDIKKNIEKVLAVLGEHGDKYDNLQEIIERVDEADYGDKTDPPETDSIQELLDYMDSLENEAEDHLARIEKQKKRIEEKALEEKKAQEEAEKAKREKELESKAAEKAAKKKVKLPKKFDLSKKADKDEYLKFIKDQGLLEKKNFNNIGIQGADGMVIPKRALTKPLVAISKQAEDLGANIHFVVGDLHSAIPSEKNIIDYRSGIYYTSNNPTIIVKVDSADGNPIESALAGVAKHLLNADGGKEVVRSFHDFINSGVFAKKEGKVPEFASLKEKYLKAYGKDQWAEELLAQVYGGGEKLPSQFKDSVDEYKNRVELIADTPRFYAISVAPYRSSNETPETLPITRDKISKRFENRVSQFANVLGLKVLSADRAVGGFVSKHGLYAGQQVNEDSYQIFIDAKEADFDTVKLFAAVCADLGHETQEAVVANQLVGSDYVNCDGSTFTVWLGESGYKQDVVDLLLKNDLGEYTYNDTEGFVQIFSVGDTAVQKAEKYAKITTLLRELADKGYLHGTRQSEDSAIRGAYLEASDRQSLYRRWLAAPENRGQERVYRALVQQALQRAKVEIKNAPLNEEIVKLQDKNKNLDWKKIKHEEIVDGGQKKTVIKRDAVSEPLFKIAELSNEIAQNEASFATKWLSQVAKKFGIKWEADKDAKSFAKSVSSTADRLYRNLKNGKGMVVYNLHDRLRSVFIIDGHLEDIEGLVRELYPYLDTSKGQLLDIANTDFGYRGVHLNLKFQDISVELQLHTKASWDVKLKQDPHYEKWRSNAAKTKADKAKYEADLKKSNEYIKDLDDEFWELRKIANDLNKKFQSRFGLPNTEGYTKEEAKALEAKKAEKKELPKQEEGSSKQVAEAEEKQPKKQEAKQAEEAKTAQQQTEEPSKPQEVEEPKKEVAEKQTKKEEKPVKEKKEKALPAKEKQAEKEEAKPAEKAKPTTIKEEPAPAPKETKKEETKEPSKPVAEKKPAAPIVKAKKDGAGKPPSSKTTKDDMMNKVIEGYENTIDNIEEEAKRVLSEQKQILTEKAEEYADRINPVRQLQRLRTISAERIGGKQEVLTDAEEVANHQAKELLLPIVNDASFYERGLNLKRFVPAITEIAKIYDDEHFPITTEGYGFGVSPVISQMLSEMSSWDSKGTATAKQTVLVCKYIRAVYRRLHELQPKLEEQARADSIKIKDQMQIIGMDKGWSGVVQKNAWKALATWNRPHATLRTILPPSGVSLFVGDVGSLRSMHGVQAHFIRQTEKQVQDFQKQHKLTKKVLRSEIELQGGDKISFAQGLFWLTQKNMVFQGEDGNQIVSPNALDAEQGLVIEKNGKPYLVEASDENFKKIEAAIRKFNKDLPEKYANFALNDVFGGKTRDLMLQREFELSGVDAGDVLPKGQYFPLKPFTSKGTLLAPVTSRRINVDVSKRRTGAVYPLDGISNDAFSIFKQNAEQTGTFAYTQKPAIRASRAVFYNAGGLDTVANRLPYEKQAFLDQYVKQNTLALKPVKTGGLGQSMISITLAKPRIAISQFFSYFSSHGQGFVSAINPAIKARAIKPSGEDLVALQNLYELFPEAGDRGESYAVFTGNVGDTKAGTVLADFANATGKVVSKITGSNAMDAFTVRSILLEELERAKRELNSAVPSGGVLYKISDKEVAEYCLETAMDRYYTQLGVLVGDKSPAQMGYLPWERDITASKRAVLLVTRMFAGAATAKLGSDSNDVIDILNYGKLKKANLDELVEKREEEADKAAEAYDKASKNAEADQKALEQAKINRRILKEESDKNPKDMEKRAKYDHAKDREEDLTSKARESKKAADEARKAADEAKAKRESAEDLRKQKQKYEKSGGTRARIVRIIAGTIANGLAMTLLGLIDDRIWQKKKWNEWDGTEIAKSFALNSTLNMYPVTRQLGSVLSGYEIEDPATLGMNQVISLVSATVKFAKDPTEANGKALLRGGIETAGIVFGIPIKTLFDYTTGLMKYFSPEASLQARNIFYQLSSTATRNFNEAVTAGDDKSAKAYLDIILNDRVGEVSQAESDELIRLAKTDNSVYPTSAPKTYKDQNGEERTITWTQQQNIKRFYSRANSQVSNMIGTALYKKLSDYQKAALIRSVYNAYKVASVYNAVGRNYGIDSLTRQALLAKTGDAKTATLIAAVAYIKELEGTKTKTKKEMAVAFVNQLPISKGEKYIVLKMAGYGVDENALVSALRQKGLTKEEANVFAK